MAIVPAPSEQALKAAKQYIAEKGDDFDRVAFAHEGRVILCSEYELAWLLDDYAEGARPESTIEALHSSVDGNIEELFESPSVFPVSIPVV